MTTQRKEFLKKQLKYSGKFVIYTWLIGGLALCILYVVNEDRLERVYPSPPEWTFLSRSAYRNGKTREEPDAFEGGVVDWVVTANTYRDLVGRLENPEIDGTGLKEQEEGGILIPGVGKMGYDIQSKSYPWRRCYYEALMGAARGAENLDGFVRDTTRKIVFPRNVVIGPSNPNPQPCPPGAASAPLEENCSPAFDSPDVYYMRILTTKGFTTRERLGAALALADWFDFKHLTDSAKEMYSWAFDIATSSLEDAGAVVDKTTGVINPNAPMIPSNVLLAATSLASHYGRNDNTPAALPILLSVLRTRRSLPPPPPLGVHSEPPEEEAKGIMPYIKSLIHSVLNRPCFPPPLPSGEDQAWRTSTSICEEAGLMAIIGEILFASSSASSSAPLSSSSSTDGLSWTQEAVEIAEAEYNTSAEDEEASEKCKECLEMALGNWVAMVSKLAGDEEERLLSSASSTSSIVTTAAGSDLTGDGQGTKVKTKTDYDKTMKNTNATSSWWGSRQARASQKSSPIDWEQELSLVEERASKIRNMLSRERFEKKGAAWFGTMLFH